MTTNPTMFDPTGAADCSECRGRREGFQIYTAVRVKDRTLLAWDVELALKFCRDGRTPIPISTAQLDDMLRVNQFDPVHLDHVDPTLPGIACAFEYTKDHSPVLCLIDGSHRAARCRRDGLPFFACVLTDEESRLCQNTTKVRLFRMVQDQQALQTRANTAGVLFDANCTKCRQQGEGPEIFTFERFDQAVFAWDIRLAREICSDRRAPFPVPPEALDAILGVNGTDPAHLDHVDPRIPGIACACGSASGQPLWVLIDGSHRAARCRRDTLPFFAYLLTDDESLRCQREVRRLLSHFS